MLMANRADLTALILLDEKLLKNEEMRHEHMLSCSPVPRTTKEEASSSAVPPTQQEVPPTQQAFTPNKEEPTTMHALSKKPEEAENSEETCKL